MEESLFTKLDSYTNNKCIDRIIENKLDHTYIVASYEYDKDTKT